MRGDIQSQVDSLNVTVISLAESLSARLDALTASLISSQSTQLSSQPRQGPDVGESQPGETAGTRRTFQALGVPNGTLVVPPNVSHPFGQGYRAPALEQLGSASAPPPQSAPGAAPPPSASQAPTPPPPRYGDPPPQPSTSGWVRLIPSGEPLLCTARWGQGRRVETLGLHLLFGDGEVGTFIPVSAGDDFIVSLADVWNSRSAEA